MSSLTSTSQKPNRIAEMYRKGEWPPEGHPWRALAQLPPEQAEGLFRSPGWAALLEGLRLLASNSVSAAMSASSLSERDEARGVYNMVEDLLQLEKSIKGLHKLLKETE